MRITKDAATVAEPVPVLGMEERPLAFLTFDARGRLVDVSASRPPPHQETPAEREAALLVQALGAKLRKAVHDGADLAELLRRARVAVDMLEQLQALEQMHGPEARQRLGGGA